MTTSYPVVAGLFGEGIRCVSVGQLAAVANKLSKSVRQNENPVTCNFGNSFAFTFGLYRVQDGPKDFLTFRITIKNLVVNCAYAVNLTGG